MKEKSLTKVIDAYYQYIERDLKCKPCNQILGKSYRFDTSEGEIKVERISLENGLDLSITTVTGNPKISFTNTFGALNILEIGYCLSGSMEIIAFPSGKVMNINKGEAFFSMLEEGVTRYDSSFYETKMLSIHFDEELLKYVSHHQWRSFINQNFGKDYSDVKAAHPAIAIKAEEIISQSREEIMSYLRVKQSVLGFIVDYFDYQISHEMTGNDIISFLKQRILENPCERVTIEMLTSEFQMSAYLIQKVFKKTTGETVYQFAKHFKLELAKSLLVKSKSSIIEISNALGYENASKFANAFLNYTGFTPKKYRTTVQNESKI